MDSLDDLCGNNRELSRPVVIYLPKAAKSLPSTWQPFCIWGFLQGVDYILEDKNKNHILYRPDIEPKRHYESRGIFRDEDVTLPEPPKEEPDRLDSLIDQMEELLEMVNFLPDGLRFISGILAPLLAREKVIQYETNPSDVVTPDEENCASDCEIISDCEVISDCESDCESDCDCPTPIDCGPIAECDIYNCFGPLDCGPSECEAQCEVDCHTQCDVVENCITGQCEQDCISVGGECDCDCTPFGECSGECFGGECDYDCTPTGPKVPNVTYITHSVYDNARDIRKLPDLFPAPTHIAIELDTPRSLVEIARDNYKQDTVELHEFYMQELQLALQEYFQSMMAIMQESGASSINDLTIAFDGERVEVPDNLAHLRDDITRKQVALDQTQRLMKKTHGTDNAIMHMRSRHTAEKERERYLDEKYGDSDSYLNSESNTVLRKSREAYNNRYNDCFMDSFRFLDSSVRQFRACLGLQKDIATDIGKMYKEGIDTTKSRAKEVAQQIDDERKKADEEHKKALKKAAASQLMSQNGKTGSMGGGFNVHEQALFGHHDVESSDQAKADKKAAEKAKEEKKKKEREKITEEKYKNDLAYLKSQGYTEKDANEFLKNSSDAYKKFFADRNKITDKKYQNDFEYLRKQGWSRKDADEYLKNSSNEYKEYFKHQKVVPATDAEYKNDLKYLMDNHYTEEQAKLTLADQPQYAERLKDFKKKKEEEAKQAASSSSSSSSSSSDSKSDNKTASSSKPSSEQKSQDKDAKKETDKESKDAVKKLEDQTKHHVESIFGVSSSSELHHHVNDSWGDLFHEATKKKYSSYRAPNGELIEQNDIDYLRKNNYSEADALNILYKDKKYAATSKEQEDRWNMEQALLHPVYTSVPGPKVTMAQTKTVTKHKVTVDDKGNVNVAPPEKKDVTVITQVTPAEAQVASKKSAQKPAVDTTPANEFVTQDDENKLNELTSYTPTSDDDCRAQGAKIQQVFQNVRSRIETKRPVTSEDEAYLNGQYVAYLRKLNVHYTAYKSQQQRQRIIAEQKTAQQAVAPVQPAPPQPTRTKEELRINAYERHCKDILRRYGNKAKSYIEEGRYDDARDMQEQAQRDMDNSYKVYISTYGISHQKHVANFSIPSGTERHDYASTDEVSIRQKAINACWYENVTNKEQMDSTISAINKYYADYINSHHPSPAGAQRLMRERGRICDDIIRQYHLFRATK